jgi:cysteine synthase B
MSSGGAAAAVGKLLQQIDEGLVVSIVCDRGDRYLSSGIYNSPS